MECHFLMLWKNIYLIIFMMINIVLLKTYHIVIINNVINNYTNYKKIFMKHI